MTSVVVGIGSNQHPEQNLCRAVGALRRHFGVLRLSSVYRSPAFGFDGPDFLNMVVGFECSESAADVTAVLADIERQQGRTRGSARYCSRPVDLDLLLFGTECDPDGRYPSPDIESYPFVLRPLAEMQPDGCHPVTQRSFAELWRRMAASGAGDELSVHPLDFAHC